MNSIQLNNALGYVDDRYLTVVDAVSKQLIKTETYKTKRVGRNLLIAAVIASLFTVTAFAAGWFGLKDMVIPGSDPITDPATGQQLSSAVLSLAGYIGSPEYEASKEWTKFHTTYRAAQSGAWIDEHWADGDEELLALSHIYPCYDHSMADKLYEISRKYDLTLHTLQTAPLSMTHFYQMAGTEPFVLSGEAYGGYIYEDGSLKIEGEAGGCSFVFMRNMAGTLPAYESGVLDPSSYEEWSYTTASGAVVCLDLNAELGDLLILYQENNAYISVCGDMGAKLTSKAEAEAFADCFDFAAACAGEPKVLEMTSSGPSAAQNAEDALNFETWITTPEYMAAAALYNFYRQNVEGHIWELYNGAYNVADPVLSEEVEALCNEYGLNFPKKVSQAFLSENDGPVEEGWENFTPQKLYDAVGQGPFIAENHSGLAYLFDDGSFHLETGCELSYIVKGSLCTTIRDMGELSTYTTWMYETSSGVVVCLATGADYYSQSLILCETENAYVVMSYNNGALEPYRLEEFAETIDFSQFL